MEFVSAILVEKLINIILIDSESRKRMCSLRSTENEDPDGEKKRLLFLLVSHCLTQSYRGV